MGQTSSKAGGGGARVAVQTTPRNEEDAFVNEMVDAMLNNDPDEIPMSQSDLQAAVEAYAMTHPGTDEDALIDTINSAAYIRENGTTPATQSQTQTQTQTQTKQAAIKKVDKGTFTNEGGGVWNMDIPGVGGGQILDETGSSRAIRNGFSPRQKVYSVSAWGANYQSLPGFANTYVTTLAQAKNEVKALIKRNL